VKIIVALLNMFHKDVLIFSCLARLTYVLRNEMEETKTKVVIISLNATPLLYRGMGGWGNCILMPSKNLSLNLDSYY
jgi:hypothetical protein